MKYKKEKSNDRIENIKAAIGCSALICIGIASVAINEYKIKFGLNGLSEFQEKEPVNNCVVTMQTIKSDSLQRTYLKPKPIKYVDGPIYFARDVSDNVKREIYSAWEKVPIEIRSEIENLGGAIYVSPDLEHEEKIRGRAYYLIATYDDIGNLSVTHLPKIEIYTDNHKSSIITKSTLLHEVGHVSDNLYRLRHGGFACETTQWVELYNTYVEDLSQIDSGIAANSYNPAELFAEVFRLYYLSPQKLEPFPECAEYIDSIVKDLTTNEPKYIPLEDIFSEEYSSF